MGNSGRVLRPFVPKNRIKLTITEGNGNVWSAKERRFLKDVFATHVDEGQCFKAWLIWNGEWKDFIRICKSDQKNQLGTWNRKVLLFL